MPTKHSSQLRNPLIFKFKKINSRTGFVLLFCAMKLSVFSNKVLLKRFLVVTLSFLDVLLTIETEIQNKKLIIQEFLT